MEVERRDKYSILSWPDVFSSIPFYLSTLKRDHKGKVDYE